MRAIILQKATRGLRNFFHILIEDGMWKPKENVIFVDDPSAMLELLADRKPSVILSGQVFYGPISGTHLARIAKSVNPNILFFIHSSQPEEGPFVDGFIEKPFSPIMSGVPELLASSLLTGEHLPRLEDLAAAFPGVIKLNRTKTA